MRKIILSMMVSLDGFTEGPDDNINWHVWDEEMNRFMGNFFNKVDTILFGRRTYELMLNYWPNASNEDPVITQKMNELPKIVFSRTLNQVEWNSTLLKEIVPEEIIRLKQKPGKDMVLFGGANLASSLIKSGLIDEFRLIVNPVVLGKGTPLFQTMDNIQEMELLAAKSFTCGNVLLQYVPQRISGKKIASKVENTTSELLQLIASLTEEELNTRPFAGSWSAGQVGDHLLKSYGVVELLQGNTRPTERPIDEKVEELRSIFLNFETKMESPEFIIPSSNHIAKDELLQHLQEKIEKIGALSKMDNLSETCLDFELPRMGLLTKYEWLHFISYHTERHNHQLNKIIENVKQQDLRPVYKSAD